MARARSRVSGRRSSAGIVHPPAQVVSPALYGGGAASLVGMTAPSPAPHPAAAPAGQQPAPTIPDAQYLAELAQQQYARQTQIDAYNSQDATDQSSTAEAVRRLLEQRDPMLQQSKVNANKAGLFYSGQLGKQLGEIENNFARRQGDLQNDLATRTSGRAAARSALEQGGSLDDAALLAAAAERQITRDETAAQDGSLVGPDVGAAPGVTLGGTQSATPGRRVGRRTVARRRGSMFGAGVRGII
jgi:hypothetical protein